MATMIQYAELFHNLICHIDAQFTEWSRVLLPLIHNAISYLIRIHICVKHAYTYNLHST